MKRISSNNSNSSSSSIKLEYYNYKYYINHHQRVVNINNMRKRRFTTTSTSCNISHNNENDVILGTILKILLLLMIVLSISSSTLLPPAVLRVGVSAFALVPQQHDTSCSIRTINNSRTRIRKTESLPFSSTFSRHRHQYRHQQMPSSTSSSAETTSLIDIRENAPRNIHGMQQWATSDAIGINGCEGFRLATDPVDESDWSISTKEHLSKGEMVVSVPSSIILSSAQIGNEYASQLQQVEQELRIIGQEQQEQQVYYQEEEEEASSSPKLISLFRLYIKLLMEYELGQKSGWYPWLNSLPRKYNNSVPMTDACFECLPPYTAMLAKQQRNNCEIFTQLIQQYVLPQDGLISETTAYNNELLKWAYNVVVTRSFLIGENGDRVIVPMIDMFNHYGGTDGPEVQISFDQAGNCIAYAARDIAAGSPLRISYVQNPTNPSPLFATYGFLDKSSPATFCKIMHLNEEMYELQLNYSNLLFYKDNGDISEAVWDLVLYSILKQQNEPENIQGFYDAYITNDIETKQQYHEYYFAYTLQTLYDHVTGMLNELDYLSLKADTYDIAKHPRISLIKQHNEFVSTVFQQVRNNLETMMTNVQQ